MADKTASRDLEESGTDAALGVGAASGLRERAQERLRRLKTPIPEDLSALSAEHARQLLHDIQVHRIELEMQNEELRASQEQLELARARYFGLFDLAPVGYVTLAESGRVLEANLTATGLLDVTRTAIANQPWTRFVLPADQDVFFLHKRELFRSGAAPGCELRLLRSNGESFWVRLESRLAQGEGETKVCRTVVSDISDRKRAEQTLEASEARHRILFQNSPDALLTLSPPNWLFTACNAASVAIFAARDERELLSRSFSDYSRERQPDDQLSTESAAARFGMALRDGSANFEWTFQRTPTEEFSATVALARMDLGGAPFLQATVRDQTEVRKQRVATAQTERLASMGFLAASMGHEINNPLAYVLSNLEELTRVLPKFVTVAARCSAELRGAVGDATFNAIIGEDSGLVGSPALAEASECARVALDGVRRIANITKALGTFARVDASDLCQVDVRRAIESALALTSNEIRFRASLVLDFKPIPLVWASEGKLSQVFLNLLINAGHATSESQHPIITVRTWSEAGSVCAAIEDTGAGIEPRNLTRVFEPFFSTKRGAASGLGLSICRNLMDELGGDIRVESELNRGTRFVIRLPVWTDGNSPRSALPPVSSDAPAAIHGRILIIDDEAPVRAVMRRLLATHDVVTVSSGNEAVAILEHDRSFDLILCDLMMPGMTGVDVHHWLVIHDPVLAARLVFVTGGAFGPVAAEYVRQAGNPKLQKPFDNDAFKDVVMATIRVSRSEPPTRLDIPVRKPRDGT